MYKTYWYCILVYECKNVTKGCVHVTSRGITGYEGTYINYFLKECADFVTSAVKAP